MDTDPHINAHPELALSLPAQCPYVAGDVQTGLHRAAHVIFMGNGMAKYRKQPIALGRGDVALVTVDDPLYLFAVSAHKEPVALGL